MGGRTKGDCWLCGIFSDEYCTAVLWRLGWIAGELKEIVLGNCFFWQHLCPPAGKGTESQNTTLGIQGRRMVAVTSVCSHTEKEDAPPEFSLGQKTSYVTWIAFWGTPCSLRTTEGDWPWAQRVDSKRQDVWVLLNRTCGLLSITMCLVLQAQVICGSCAYHGLPSYWFPFLYWCCFAG